MMQFRLVHVEHRQTTPAFDVLWQLTVPQAMDRMHFSIQNWKCG